MGYGQYTVPRYRRHRTVTTPGDPYLYHQRHWLKADLVRVARQRWRYIHSCRMYKYRTLEFKATRLNHPERTVWQLYMTPIVVLSPGAHPTVTLDTGGWNTRTTRRRMGEILRDRLNINARLYAIRDTNLLTVNASDGYKTWQFKRRVELPLAEIAA